MNIGKLMNSSGEVGEIHNLVTVKAADECLYLEHVNKAGRKV